MHQQQALRPISPVHPHQLIGEAVSYSAPTNELQQLLVQKVRYLSPVNRRPNIREEEGDKGLEEVVARRRRLAAQQARRVRAMDGARQDF
jgi:hypothetical protein